MTNTARPNLHGDTARKHAEAHRTGIASRALLFCAIVSFTVLLLWFVIRTPSDAVAATRSGLLVAGHSVIPSLFPFFVLSSLLTESGTGERMLGIVAKGVATLFGVSRVGATAILFGAFCGFPVGARIVTTLYRQGAIGRQEAERLLILSNTPSFAFLYATVGAGFFRSAAFGLRLYASVLLSNVIVGILLRLTGKSSIQKAYPLRKSAPRFASLIANAITSAAQSSLTVAASLTFFTTLNAAIDALGALCGIPEAVRLLLSGIFELTTGIQKAAETSCGLCGLCLCGFFAGFGGLCAHLQVIATAELPLPDRAEKEALTFRSYFLWKTIQGLLVSTLLILSDRLL